MQKYEDLKTNIESFRARNFDFEKYTICYEEVYVSTLLRDALICYNQISTLTDKTQCKDLKNQLDVVLGGKFKELNPQFSSDVVQNMLNYCKRGIFKYPIDIFVVSDCVLAKEGTFDDSGMLYKMKTFMFDDNGTYVNAFQSFYFCFDESMYTYPKKETVSLTNEKEMEISKFISDNINDALFDKFECYISKPMYELNSASVFFGYKGLVENQMRGINIFLNKRFKNIAMDIIEKCECDIRMLVQNNEDISLYNFHQSFEDDVPVWTAKKLDTPVWILSEEAIKKEKNLSSRKKQLNRNHILY